MEQKKFMSLGLVFVIVGVLWLLQKMGIIDGSFWDYLAPVLIILIGLDLLNKKEKKSHFWFKGFDFSQPFHSRENKDRKIVDEQ